MSSPTATALEATTGAARPPTAAPSKWRRWLKLSVAVLALIVLVLAGLGWWWSDEPRPFDVLKHAEARAHARGESVRVGYATTSTLIRVAETLLYKPGGYLTNDALPPAIFMDNMPEWEWGVLQQVRDLTRALRNDYSRSQTQSIEDPDLQLADPLFNVDSRSWLLPPAEREYREGIRALERYLGRLVDNDDADAQFYARADNLRDYLGVVEKRLGSLSKRLSASVASTRVNTDLSGDPAATQSTPAADERMVKTPWLEIDNVFYEARGASWAHLHFLKAIEIDFRSVLENKNALASLRQIIRDLEAAQTPLGSPMVLNGSGFGLFANHSLVMANYLSRANAALIDLRRLLSEG